MHIDTIMEELIKRIRKTKKYFNPAVNDHLKEKLFLALKENRSFERSLKRIGIRTKD